MPRLDLTLQEVRRDQIRFEARTAERTSSVTVVVFRSGGVLFPHPRSDSGESLGSDELNALVVRRAEEIIRLRRGLRRDER